MDEKCSLLTAFDLRALRELSIDHEQVCFRRLPSTIPTLEKLTLISGLPHTETIHTVDLSNVSPTLRSIAFKLHANKPIPQLLSWVEGSLRTLSPTNAIRHLSFTIFAFGLSLRFIDRLAFPAGFALGWDAERFGSRWEPIGHILGSDIFGSLVRVKICTFGSHYGAHPQENADISWEDISQQAAAGLRVGRPDGFQFDIEAIGEEMRSSIVWICVYAPLDICVQITKVDAQPGQRHTATAQYFKLKQTILFDLTILGDSYYTLGDVPTLRKQTQSAFQRLTMAPESSRRVVSAGQAKVHGMVHRNDYFPSNHHDHHLAMQSPQNEIPRVVAQLVSSISPDQQQAAVMKYFKSDASFSHPICSVSSGPDSRDRILAIYQWYRVMSPKIDVEVKNVLFDPKTGAMVLDLSQVFHIRFSPFAPAKSHFKTYLTLVEEDQKWYISRQEDYYDLQQFLNLIIPPFATLTQPALLAAGLATTVLAKSAQMLGVWAPKTSGGSTVNGNA